MDKIRENSFAISVAVLGVGLLVLIFVLIIQPRFLDEGELSALEGRQRTIDRYASEEKTPQLELPTPELLEATKERNERLESELSSAVRQIEERAKKFEQFPPNPDWNTIPPAPGQFQATYVTDNEKLIKEYQDKFPEALPDEPDQPGGRRRDADAGLQVNLIKTFNTAEDVVRGMKELWMTQQFFKSAHDLNLGGLKKIDFPQRNRPVDGMPPHYGAVHAQVEIHLPLRLLGQYLSSVFASEHVPFELVNLSVTRLPETLIAEQVKSLSYEEGNAEDNRRQADLDAHPGSEPLVRAVMDFHGIDWKGFPDDAAGKGKPRKLRKS